MELSEHNMELFEYNWCTSLGVCVDPLWCNPSCLMRWVIALTPGDKWNRQLNVGLVVCTCSIELLAVSGIVIACLSYKCIPIWQHNMIGIQSTSTLTPFSWAVSIAKLPATNGLFNSRVRSVPPVIALHGGVRKAFHRFLIVGPIVSSGGIYACAWNEEQRTKRLSVVVNNHASHVGGSHFLRRLALLRFFIFSSASTGTWLVSKTCLK